MLACIQGRKASKIGGALGRVALFIAATEPKPKPRFETECEAEIQNQNPTQESDPEIRKRTPKPKSKVEHETDIQNPKPMNPNPEFENEIQVRNRGPKQKSVIPEIRDPKSKSETESETENETSNLRQRQQNRLLRVQTGAPLAARQGHPCHDVFAQLTYAYIILCCVCEVCVRVYVAVASAKHCPISQISPVVFSLSLQERVDHPEAEDHGSDLQHDCF